MKHKLTDIEKCGAEQFYGFLQSSLAGIKTEDESISDLIVIARGYVRNKFIEFLKEGAK